MEGLKTQTLGNPPDDLPFFAISSHELYGVASKLIQSDGDKHFLESIFGEIQKIHKEEEVRGGGGIAKFSYADYSFSHSLQLSLPVC